MLETLEIRRWLTVAWQALEQRTRPLLWLVVPVAALKRVPHPIEIPDSPQLKVEGSRATWSLQAAQRGMLLEVVVSEIDH